ncbi:hypothetical protein [Bacillus sp. THAF10]|nr:hypothetical protein [Bacillus sp. THAF10]
MGTVQVKVQNLLIFHEKMGFGVIILVRWPRLDVLVRHCDEKMPEI